MHIRGAAEPGALDEAFARVAELENLFSLFRPDSEVCRLNGLAVGESLPVSFEVREVLRLALDVWRASGGGFNPFGEYAGSRDPFAIARGSVRRVLPAVTLDLNGIAKGFVVDEVTRLLDARFPACAICVEAGGDLRRVRWPADDPVWVRAPDGSGGAYPFTFAEESLATSAFGGAARYLRRSRWGEGVSVSVVAQACAVADALTKVGLFASAEVASEVAAQFGARFLFLGASA